MCGLLPLQPFIGLEKTLVITCHECLQPEAHDGQVFTYQCLGNMLRKDDHLQQECIRYYLDVKQCRQIILVGHYDCNIIQKILAESSIHTPLTVLQYNLEKILRAYAHSLLQPVIKDRMLIELNIIEQLRLLMTYAFIYKKVNTGILKVSGIVYDHQANTIEEIFRNGITFNNLIDSN